MIKRKLITLLHILSFALITFLCSNKSTIASPIISGISSNEINIDTEFHGTKILLFGAKGDAGNIVVVVRGPKKDFLITKKQKLLGIWYNGKRVTFKNSYSFYSLFSTFNNKTGSQEALEHLLSELELGENNLNIHGDDPEKEDEFRLQLIDKLEKNKLYSLNANVVEFLDETLFKVILDFPKNISRGTYSVEIYLINEGGLVSFQSIPIHVNQVGLSAKILDFAYQDSFLYGLLTVAIALVVGWLANYLFARFFDK